MLEQTDGMVYVKLFQCRQDPRLILKPVGRGTVGECSGGGCCGGGFTVGGGAGRQCLQGYTVGGTVGGCGRGVGGGDPVGGKMLGVLWERALRPLEILRVEAHP